MLAGEGAKNFAISMGFKKENLINQKSQEKIGLNGKKMKNINLLLI